MQFSMSGAAVAEASPVYFLAASSLSLLNVADFSADI